MEKEERGQLEAIITKGNCRPQKVINGLILLNCDGEKYQNQRMKNEYRAAVLKIRMRKIDRGKKRFVEEGFEVALSGRKGERVYRKKADGDFEAHLIALGCSEPLLRLRLRFVTPSNTRSLYFKCQVESLLAHPIS